MTQPTLMLPYDLQLANEHRFSKHHIDRYIRKEIEANEWMQAKVQEGVAMLNDWLNGQYYESKMARLEQVRGLDLEELVLTIFVQIAYCQREELFTSVTAQLAGRLHFSEKREGIQTIAEMVAVLCATDVFDINKLSNAASLMIQSRIPLSDELLRYVYDSRFLPPMVCPPKLVTHNHESGHLTHNDSLVLGKGNHHDGDLCLDVINLQNQIPLKLDVDFLLAMEEEPNKPFSVENVKDKALEEGEVLTDAQAKEILQQQIDNWDSFKAESNQMYMLMINQGNRFYLTNKVDKRGRLYAIGYHITTQGSAFKKAIVELADEEIVEGV